MKNILQSAKTRGQHSFSRRRLITALALAASATGIAHAQQPEFQSAAQAIVATLRDHLYRPKPFDMEAYRNIEKALREIGETAQSTEDFFTRADRTLRTAPDSHLFLLRPAPSPAERAAQAASQPAQPEAVTLTWNGTAAILTVNTMSGDDTIKKIDAAYGEITAHGAQKLIIDLRRNGGGAFAVLPLVGHLITKPTDAGVFATRRWYESHDTGPGPNDFASAEAMKWRETLPNFQADMLSRALTSYRIEPVQPHFSGPVYVLTSKVSISAAEIAVDALKTQHRATIIGEKTPGVLLSANVFQLPGGFQLVLPIADYYSISGAHIERNGIQPDIPVEAAKALAMALEQ